MTVTEFQRGIAARLNADETLRKGGCKAFAEDAQDLYFEVATQLEAQGGGVAIVVATPEGERLGDDEDDAVLFELPAVEVVCTEKPGVSRTKPENFTALRAALRAALLLDSDELQFQRYRQEADEKAGTLSAIATFASSVPLALDDTNPQP